MQVDDLIGFKYRIDRIIGRGGMGVVVAATNLLLGQRVAVKYLLPDLVKDKSVVERFLREARASARLRSEHICRIFDVDIEAGAPYIVMELLEGKDLEWVMKSRVALSISTIVDYVVQATVGMAEAHGLGIVHRDLKPSNLFLTTRPDGSPLIKVLDFGIAKAPIDAQLELTRTTTVMGSPGYMSPEQLRSARAADARSDIWALGVILFELLSGQQPFAAESITELTLRVVIDPTPPLPGVPTGLAEVVRRCLEKDPARRFTTMGELAEALAPFGLAQSGRAATRAASTTALPSANLASMPAPGSPPTTLGSSVTANTHRTSRSRRPSWIAAGSAIGVLVAGIFVIAFIWFDGREAPETRPAEQEMPAAVDAAAPTPQEITVSPNSAPAPASPPTTPAPPLPAAPAPPIDAGVPLIDEIEITSDPIAPTQKTSPGGKAPQRKRHLEPKGPVGQSPASTLPKPAPSVTQEPSRPPEKIDDVGESRE